MNEIVKYENSLNRLNFKGFSQTNMNMFMALCSQMKDQKDRKIVLSFDKIKELTAYDKKKKGIDDFVEDLEHTNEQLMKVNCKIITGNKRTSFILFPTFETDLDTETLTVYVNPDLMWLLNEMKAYTTFELAEFVDLKSKYSKNLYRLLKQWRTVGKYTFNDIPELRKLMDVPESYSNKHFMSKCISAAVKEISELDRSFVDFKCEPVYAQKRGRPLEKIVFTWKAEKVKKPPHTDGPVQAKTKSDNSPKKSNKFKNFDERSYSERFYELQMKRAGILGLTPEEEQELKELSRRSNT